MFPISSKFYSNRIKAKASMWAWDSHGLFDYDNIDSDL